MDFSRKNRATIIFTLAASLLLLAFFPAHSAASELTLAWDPNTEGDLAGYKIYYGTQSGTYDFVVDVGNVMRYTVTGLDPETQYYFSITAYDTSGNESDYSAEVSASTYPPYPPYRIISGLGGTSGGWIEEFTEDYSHAYWVRVGWAGYNSANGEGRIATGDIDGDGRDEIVIGLGPAWEQPYPDGYFEVLDDDHTHLAWGRIQWESYNGTNGESRPACGDVDGDGHDEIIIGLGSRGGGYFEIFDFEAGNLIHKDWGRVNWAHYDSTNGESRPACGDVDGDGYDEIIIGLGAGSAGYFEVFDHEGGSITHKDWGRVNWKNYNQKSGKTRAACGDVDGDGYDEIIIGLGAGGGGYFEVFDHDGGSVTHKDWGVVRWTWYNKTNGETRPACGDIDADGRDEIVMGLGQGAGGYLEVFDDAPAGYAHLAWPRIHWESYNSVNGETWPAVKK